MCDGRTGRIDRQPADPLPELRGDGHGFEIPKDQSPRRGALLTPAVARLWGSRYPAQGRTSPRWPTLAAVCVLGKGQWLPSNFADASSHQPRPNCLDHTSHDLRKPSS